MPLLLCAAVAQSTSSVSVHCSERACQIASPGAAWTARATFNDTVNASGWGVLHVESNAQATDEDQAFAAGFAEGYVTVERTMQHHHTFMAATFGNDSQALALATKFVGDNDEYVKRQIAKPPDPAIVPGQPTAEQLRSWTLERHDSPMVERAIEQMPAHERPNAY